MDILDLSLILYIKLVNNLQQKVHIYQLVLLNHLHKEPLEQKEKQIQASMFKIRELIQLTIVV